MFRWQLAPLQYRYTAVETESDSVVWVQVLSGSPPYHRHTVASYVRIDFRTAVDRGLCKPTLRGARCAQPGRQPQRPTQAMRECLSAAVLVVR